MEVAVIATAGPGMHATVVMLTVVVALVLFAIERIPLATTEPDNTGVPDSILRVIPLSNRSRHIACQRLF